MKRFLLLPVLLLSLHHKSAAQPHPSLSSKDSMRLRYFLDTAFQCPVYSFRRQLFLDSALAITPRDAYLWQQKAMPLEKRKKYELALPFLDSAVKYDAGSYMDYRAFIKCIFQKSYRSALQDFYAAKSLHGDAYVMDHPYDFYIGLCHLQLNAIDSAITYFTRCIDRRRQKGGDAAVHFLHWFYLGVAHYTREDYERAGPCFDKSLSQYGKFSDAKYYKAQCLHAGKQLGAALALMLEAQHNLALGYTINEDNAIYEAYPYQINKFYVDGEVNYLKSVTGK